MQVALGLTLRVRQAGNVLVWMKLGERGPSREEKVAEKEVVEELADDE